MDHLQKTLFQLFINFTSEIVTQHMT